LIELIIVIVVLGILSAYAAMKTVSPADVTLPSQAQKMATDLRHAQTLANTWGTSLVVSASGSVYSVSCLTATSTAPCNASPVIDPASGAAFSVGLQQGVSFISPTSATLTFNSLGQPGGAAGYTLSSGGNTKTVAVAAITGKVTP
jgi:MSHA pilin protein MshC